MIDAPHLAKTMTKRISIILGSITLVLLGYGAWTTAGIIRLEARLEHLESGHRALGRYTYDFGAALTHLSESRGLSDSELAKLILAEMRQDELLRASISSSRVRSILVGSRLWPHNSVEQSVQ